jgi:catechol 2,3-dioxygenase-like lactoylglutathione lyase family enzyme
MKASLVLIGAALIWCVGVLAADTTADGYGSVKGAGLNVADIEKSTRFYTEVFGLKIVRQIPSGPIKDATEVVLSANGVFDLKDTSLLVLFHLANQSLPEGRTAFGRILSITSNADAVASRARAAGYAAIKSAKEASVTMITDPDGYQIELIQPPT